MFKYDVYNNSVNMLSNEVCPFFKRYSNTSLCVEQLF